jgi:sulfate adenylyltransferase subunit 2
LTIDEKIEFKNIRFRTVWDITCTWAIESEANTIDKIIDEIKCSNISERWTRADDMASKCAMEDRKKKWYF